MDQKEFLRKADDACGSGRRERRSKVSRVGGGLYEERRRKGRMQVREGLRLPFQLLTLMPTLAAGRATTEAHFRRGEARSSAAQSKPATRNSQSRLPDSKRASRQFNFTIIRASPKPLLPFQQPRHRPAVFLDLESVLSHSHSLCTLHHVGVRASTVSLTCSLQKKTEPWRTCQPLAPPASPSLVAVEVNPPRQRPSTRL